jgi:hypothetical protein
MEGGKPGWNDAMNGLPGLFGSGTPETFELKRLIKFITDNFNGSETVVMPAEIAKYLDDVKAALDEYNNGTINDFQYWDKVATIREAYEKKRAEIINDCKKKQQKAENEKRVMLAVLDAGLSVCNVIYYDHSNELVFNWKDYETKVTENDFNKFVSSVNRSLLPAGITFKMK